MLNTSNGRWMTLNLPTSVIGWLKWKLTLISRNFPSNPAHPCCVKDQRARLSPCKINRPRCEVKWRASTEHRAQCHDTYTFEVKWSSFLMLPIKWNIFIGQQHYRCRNFNLNFRFASFITQCCCFVSLFFSFVSLFVFLLDFIFAFEQMW